METPASEKQNPITLAYETEKQDEMSRRNRESENKEYDIIAMVGLGFALPGPVVVLFAYIRYGELNANAFGNTLVYLCLSSAAAIIMGLISIRRWKGLMTLGVCLIWWLWLIWYASQTKESLMRS